MKVYPCTRMTNPSDLLIHESNQRLCEVFEMLVSRLDTIEERLDMIIMNKQHTDSFIIQNQNSDSNTNSVSFSGLTHCGRCVELHVEKIRFDVRGVFDFDYSDGTLFLTTPECRFSGQGIQNWERDPSGTTYDLDLRQIWGTERYDAIRTRITYLHSTKTPVELATYSTKCNELGIASDHDDLPSALYEIVLKNRVPTITALGWSGIAVKCDDLKTAVQAMDCASKLFGAKLSNYIQINNIPSSLLSLALAYLRNTEIKTHFSNLDDQSQMDAREMRGARYSGSFFEENTDFSD